jgi:hypothetical protein
VTVRSSGQFHLQVIIESLSCQEKSRGKLRLTFAAGASAGLPVHRPNPGSCKRATLRHFRPRTAPPPRAITATRKFPKIPANPSPTTTSRPSGPQNPLPGVHFRPTRRYNQPEPTTRPTRSARTPPAPSSPALVSSVRAGLQGTLCGAQGEAASLGRAQPWVNPPRASETMEHGPIRPCDFEHPAAPVGRQVRFPTLSERLP